MIHEDTTKYQNYVGIEWSQAVVLVSRMRSNSTRIVETKSLEPSIRILREYLQNIRGSKIITIEETTTSHWLYTELIDIVDRVLICDPYRNGLMKDGPKNDKRDSETLCKLLRNGLLKEVYHSDDKLFELRKFVSVYNDFVKASVRIKNQHSALYRAIGKKVKVDKELKFEGELLQFIHEAQSDNILYLKKARDKFEKKIDEYAKENTDMKRLIKISGIGNKLAIMILSIVIDMNRFENKYKFWSYCGLISYERESGGRLYGRKKPRYNRLLKGVFKSASMAARSGNNDIREYYEYLIKGGLSYSNASNQIARYIAKTVYGVLKYKTDYRSYQWRENIKTAA